MSHFSKLPFCRHSFFQLLCNLHENADGVLIAAEGFFIRLRQDQDHMAKKTGETCVYQIELLWVLYLHAYTTHTHTHTHTRIAPCEGFLRVVCAWHRGRLGPHPQSPGPPQIPGRRTFASTVRVGEGKRESRPYLVPLLAYLSL